MNTASTDTAALPHLTAWHTVGDVAWERCLAGALRHEQAGQTWTQQAHGRSLGLLFFNPSLRTRTSMELAGAQLGAHVTTLTAGQGTWDFAWEDGQVMDGSEAEHIREAIGVLSQYYNALGVRAFASMTDYEQDRTDALLHAIVRAATVPVVSLESAFYHPCQALGDAATLKKHFDGDARGRRFVLQWTYHPKALPMAVPNSALLMSARLGLDVTVARPDGYALDAGVMEQARQYAAAHGTTVIETDDREAAAEGADVIYAKAWGGALAYSDPEREAALRQQHRAWRVTPALMGRTRNAAFMHCLPVRRGVVVDDAVLDGPQAIHLLQAAFRLHAQKAMLEYIWGVGAWEGGGEDVSSMEDR